MLSKDHVSNLVEQLDLVLFQANSGVRILDRVHGFFEQYCKQQHGAAMQLVHAAIEHQKMMENTPIRDRMRSSWDAIMAFFQLIRDMGNDAMDMVNKTNGKVLVPLKALQMTHKRIVQTNESETFAMMGKLRELTDVVQHAEKITNASIEAATAVKEKKQWKKKRDIMLKKIAEYKRVLRDCNEQTNFYRTSIAPTIVEKVVEGEALRIKSLEQVLVTYASLQDYFARKSVEMTKKLNRLAQMIDTHNDLQEFAPGVMSSRGQGSPQNIPRFAYTLLPCPEVAPPEKNLFGVSLEEVMAFQRKSCPSLAKDMTEPLILHSLAEAVVNNGGLTTEGIFRISANQVDLDQLRHNLESGVYHVPANVNPHVPAALLKFWLRELADPLIPYDLYAECIAIGKEVQNDLESTATYPRVLAVVGKLPQLQGGLIRTLLTLTRRIAAHEEVNKMGVYNLAVVLYPSFFRGPARGVELTAVQVMSDSKAGQAFVMQLLHVLRKEDNFLVEREEADRKAACKVELDRVAEEKPTDVRTDSKLNADSDHSGDAKAGSEDDQNDVRADDGRESQPAAAASLVASAESLPKPEEATSASVASSTGANDSRGTPPTARGRRHASAGQADSISSSSSSSSASSSSTSSSSSSSALTSSSPSSPALSPCNSSPSLDASPTEDEKDKHEKNALVRDRIRQEILDTEKKYVASLRLLNLHYVGKIKHMQQNLSAFGNLTTQQCADLASNVELLAGIHEVFLKELTTKKSLASVFLKFHHLFKNYTDFLNGYERIIDAINQLQKNKKFVAALNEVRAQLRQDGGLELMSYMIMPVQRVPRYVLLLNELLKHTVETDEEHKHLVEALNEIKGVATAINDGKKRMESMSLLLEIQQKIKGAPANLASLVQPHRKLLRKGQVIMVTAKGKDIQVHTKKEKARVMFLFSDMLLWTTAAHQWRGQMNLSGASVSEKDLPEEQFAVDAAQKHIVVKVMDPKKREEWKQQLTDTMTHLRGVRDGKRSMRRRGKINAGHSGNDVHGLLMQKLGGLQSGSRTGTLSRGQLVDRSTLNSSLKKPLTSETI